MRAETIILSEERKVTLSAYLQEVGGEFGNIARRPGLLVLPGGGYSMCSDREADPVALAFAQAGYQTFILRYSVGEHAAWPQPLEDYEQAMETLLGHAEAWHLDPERIAVIGFSAGGHLAAAAATLARHKPAAAILGYPVTEGDTARSCLASAPDLVSAVNSRTSPCFLFATRTDNVVPISNTLQFTLALANAGVSFESHVYAYGPHGFSVGNSSVVTPGTELCSRAGHWVADSIAWLKDMLGDFGDGAMTKPRLGTRINDDCEATLSVDCTMAHLMANPAARELLAPMMAAAKERMAAKYGEQMQLGGNGDAGQGLGAKMTLRSALAYGNTPAAVVEQLDAALRQIPNT